MNVKLMVVSSSFLLLFCTSHCE